MAQRATPPTPTPAERVAVREVIEPAVVAAGCDLEDVSLRNSGSRRVLRVLVDADGGVTLDTVADVSRAIGAVLDASDVMGQWPYLLDVGSPGVDRPLTLLRHWRRNEGRLVRITGQDGDVRVGRILGAEGGDRGEPPSAVVIEGDEGRATIHGEQIRRAVVQVEFTGKDEG